MTQCSYFYHTMTNVPAKRCAKQEGHEGEHVEENLFVTKAQQGNQPTTGWIKH